MKIVLASASPRRAALLRQLGLSFTIMAPNVDERVNDNEPPIDYVQRVATAKAMAIGAQLDAQSDACGDDQGDDQGDDHRVVINDTHTQSHEPVVIAADTVAVFAGQILGKAETRAQAKQMLTAVRGQAQQVLTALVMLYQGQWYRHVSQSTVYMAQFDEALLAAYLDCGDWAGKAGACSLQGRGGLLIQSITGDLQATVGLSFSALYEGFKTFNLQQAFLMRIAQPLLLKEKDNV